MMKSLPLAFVAVLTVSPVLSEPGQPRIAFADDDTAACRELRTAVDYAKPRPPDPLMTKWYHIPSGCIGLKTGVSVKIETEVVAPIPLSCVRVTTFNNEPFCRWIASRFITEWIL